MSKPILPKVRGVETFMSDAYRINQLESRAIDSQPQFIDPKLLVVSPYQPRTSFPEDEMNDLRQSIISAGGIKVPAIVRPNINELITGGKRQIIAIELGYLLPVYWHTCTDLEAAELAGFENVKRSDLNPIDETNLVINMVRMRLNLPDRVAAIDLIQKIRYQQRKDSGAQSIDAPLAIISSSAGMRSIDAPLDMIGLSVGAQSIDAPLDMISSSAGTRSINVPLDTVSLVEKTIRDFTKGQLSLTTFGSHKLKLLNLPPEIVEAIKVDSIEPTKAVEIAKVADPAARSELLDRVVEEGLSVAQVKKEVAKNKPPKVDKTPKQGKSIVDDPVIESEGDSTPVEESLNVQVPKVQLEQPQLDLSGSAHQEAIDNAIQDMTETIRFKISNDAYTLEIKQEIQALLCAVIKLMS